MFRYIVITLNLVLLGVACGDGVRLLNPNDLTKRLVSLSKPSTPESQYHNDSVIDGYVVCLGELCRESKCDGFNTEYSKAVVLYNLSSP